MVEIVCVGDLHLGGLNKELEKYTPTGDSDDFIYKALDNAQNYALENGIDHVIILGDVYHTPYPDQSSQKRFLSWIEKSSLQWYTYPGNHDCLLEEDGDHSMIMAEYTARNLDNLKIFTEPTLHKIEGIPFSFLPWPHKKPITKKPSMVAAHITLSGTKGDSGKVITKGVQVDTSSSDYYWVIGDLHTYQTRNNILYTGTMYQRTFGEKLPKGFSHVTAEIKNGKLKVEHEFIITPPPFELNFLRISKMSDLDKIVSDKKRPHLYKLRVSSGIMLPNSVRIDYPNIIDVDYDNPADRLDGKKEESVPLEVDNPLSGLTKFMKKQGATFSQRKLAREMARSYTKSLLGV